jgi:gluconokinase
MSQGVGLNDEDRKGWLQKLATVLAQAPAPVVMTCSALKLAYREQLRQAAPGLRFVYLQLSPQLAQERVAGRGASHFFSPALVQNQFATLQEPLGEPRTLVLGADLPPEVLQLRISEWLHTRQPV